MCSGLLEQWPPSQILWYYKITLDFLVFGSITICWAQKIRVLYLKYYVCCRSLDSTSGGARTTLPISPSAYQLPPIVLETNQRRIRRKESKSYLSYLASRKLTLLPPRSFIPLQEIGTAEVWRRSLTSTLRLWWRRYLHDHTAMVWDEAHEWHYRKIM